MSIIALSFLQREQLFGQGAHDIEMPDAPDYYAADNWQDIDSDEEEAFQTLPAGEEGLFHSHAGKEAVFTQIFDKCQKGRGDSRRRALRVQLMVDSWREQMPYLVDAYLDLKRDGPLDSKDVMGAWGLEVLGLEKKGTHLFTHINAAKRTNQSLL
ncbi:hypothetical protein C8J57DRAFT_1502399 [Mycena rebaudengoi]|nr:hypothetical protein C8J57DRAFT_1502399 [Mycena rebaudengoi]